MIDAVYTEILRYVYVLSQNPVAMLAVFIASCYCLGAVLLIRLSR